MIGISLIIMCD